MLSLFKNWKKLKFNYTIDANKKLSVITEGKYDSISLKLITEVYPTENITFTYSFDAPPTNITSELGLELNLGKGFDHVKCARKGYWSSYPENSLGATSGMINIFGTNNNYRQQPTSSWVNDTKSFYYSGLNSQAQLSHVARASKTNIYNYSVINSKTQKFIAIAGTGSESCRLKLHDGELQLIVANIWDYPNLVLVL